MPLRPSGHSHGGSTLHSAAPSLWPSTALWLLWGRVPSHQAIELPVRSSSSGCVISTKPFTSWNLCFLVCGTGVETASLLWHAQPALSFPSLICHPHRLFPVCSTDPKCLGCFPWLPKQISPCVGLLHAPVCQQQAASCLLLLGQAEQGLVLCAVWLYFPALWFSHL